MAGFIQSGRFGGGAFDPTSYTSASCVLWLDPTDAATFTFSSGNIVSQWNDKSGNSRHVSQGTVANQPARNGTTNGLSTVVFDGTDDVLTSGAAAQWVNASDGTWTAWALYVPSSVTGTRSVVDSDDVGSGRFAQYIRANGTTPESIAFDSGGTPFTDSGSATLSTSSVYILTAIHRATSVEIYVNGATNGATATTGTNKNGTGKIQVGAFNPVSPSSFAQGQVGDVVFYSGAQNTTDLNGLGNALATRYGVSWTTI